MIVARTRLRHKSDLEGFACEPLVHETGFHPGLADELSIEYERG